MQRTMLSVLRRVAAACPAALPPHWKELVPSICAIVQVGGVEGVGNREAVELECSRVGGLSWPAGTRCIAAGAGALRTAHLSDCLPHSIGCPQGSAGPTKVAAERTLARVLALEKGIEPALAWVPQGGPLARTIMQVSAVCFG